MGPKINRRTDFPKVNVSSSKSTAGKATAMPSSDFKSVNHAKRIDEIDKDVSFRGVI